jgi:hypothetical protein
MVHRVLALMIIGAWDLHSGALPWVGFSGINPQTPPQINLFYFEALLEKH